MICGVVDDCVDSLFVYLFTGNEAEQEQKLYTRKKAWRCSSCTQRSRKSECRKCIVVIRKILIL